MSHIGRDQQANTQRKRTWLSTKLNSLMSLLPRTLTHQHLAAALAPSSGTQANLLRSTQQPLTIPTTALHAPASHPQPALPPTAALPPSAPAAAAAALAAGNLLSVGQQVEAGGFHPPYLGLHLLSRGSTSDGVPETWVRAKKQRLLEQQRQQQQAQQAATAAALNAHEDRHQGNGVAHDAPPSASPQRGTRGGGGGVPKRPREIGATDVVGPSSRTGHGIRNLAEYKRQRQQYMFGLRPRLLPPRPGATSAALTAAAVASAQTPAPAAFPPAAPTSAALTPAAAAAAAAATPVEGMRAEAVTDTARLVLANLDYMAGQGSYSSGPPLSLLPTPHSTPASGPSSSSRQLAAAVPHSYTSSPTESLRLAGLAGHASTTALPHSFRGMSTFLPPSPPRVERPAPPSAAAVAEVLGQTLLPAAAPAPAATATATAVTAAGPTPTGDTAAAAGAPSEFRFGRAAGRLDRVGAAVRDRVEDAARDSRSAPRQMAADEVALAAAVPLPDDEGVISDQRAQPSSTAPHSPTLAPPSPAGAAAATATAATPSRDGDEVDVYAPLASGRFSASWARGITSATTSPLGTPLPSYPADDVTAPSTSIPAPLLSASTRAGQAAGSRAAGVDVVGGRGGGVPSGSTFPPADAGAASAVTAGGATGPPATGGAADGPRMSAETVSNVTYGGVGVTPAAFRHVAGTTLFDTQRAASVTSGPTSLGGLAALMAESSAAGGGRGDAFGFLSGVLRGAATAAAVAEATAAAAPAASRGAAGETAGEAAGETAGEVTGETAGGAAVGKATARQSSAWQSSAPAAFAFGVTRAPAWLLPTLAQRPRSPLSAPQATADSHSSGSPRPSVESWPLPSPPPATGPSAAVAVDSHQHRRPPAHAVISAPAVPLSQLLSFAPSEVLPVVGAAMSSALISPVSSADNSPPSGVDVQPGTRTTTASVVVQRASLSRMFGSSSSLFPAAPAATTVVAAAQVADIAPAGGNAPAGMGLDDGDGPAAAAAVDGSGAPPPPPAVQPKKFKRYKRP